MRFGIKLAAIAAASVLSIGACGGKKSGGTTTPPPGDGSAAAAKSLYDRLGGKEAITLVVDDMVANIAADGRINAFFANADIPHLKAMLVDQICSATGGPCQYTGKDMKTMHADMHIKEADFNALVEDLVTALDKYKVGEQEKGELLGALGGMKPDIVTAQ